MIVKIAVLCVAISNCLQFVAIERQRQALKRAKYDIKTLEKAITALERK